MYFIALEEFDPKIYRFTTSVFPSDDDDVITSPYNRLIGKKKKIRLNKN